MYFIIFERLLLEAVVDVFYFPIWWYTGGLKHAFLWCYKLFKRGNNKLAPGLWLQNILVPMFGQFDWQGRIISFFMRLAQIIGRSVALLFWLVICLALFVGWILIPVIIFFGLQKSAGK